MSICEAQLLQLQQILDSKLNETAALEDQIAIQLEALMRVEKIDRKAFLGPLLIGSLLELFLFGVLSMQICHYHRHFTSDGLVLKLIAWISFLGSLALTIAVFTDSWYRFIAKNVIFVQDSMTPSSEIATVMIALLGLLSQTFFSWRIYELSLRRWWQALVCCLAVAQFAAFITINVHYVNARTARGPYDFINTPSLSALWAKRLPTTIWMTTSIACSLTITASMAVLLYPAFKEATASQVRKMLSTILLLTFETGIVSTILAILVTPLILSEVPSTQYKSLIFFYPCGILHSTWLLSSLSARPPMDKQTSSNISTTRSDIHFRTNTTRQHEITVAILTPVAQDHGAEEESQPTTVRAELPSEK